MLRTREKAWHYYVDPEERAFEMVIRYGRSRKIRRQEPLAMLGFSLFFAFSFMKSTMMIAWMTPTITRFVTYASYALAISSIMMIERYSWKELSILAIIGTVSILITGVSDSNIFFMFFLYVIPLADVNKERIVKTAFLIGLSITALTVLLSQMGVLENLVYYQEGHETGSRVRQSMGFVYPTDFAAHIFFLLLMVFYLKKGKLSILTGMMYLGSAWFVKTYCDARLSMISIIGIMIAAVWMTFRKNKPLSGIMRKMVIIAAPLAATLTFVMEVMYSKGMGVAISLNRLLSSRLSIGVKMLNQYGVGLLGQMIEQHGNGRTTQSVLQLYGEYTYIDMSFQRILQMYGIIAFVVLLFFVVITTKKCLERGEICLPIIMAMIAISAVVDQHYMDFGYNVFLFLLLDHTKDKKPAIKIALQPVRS